MMIRLNIYILLGTVFIILTWLFVGLYRDDEFYEPHLFTKYRPTIKVNFYSPIGMSDQTVKDLPEDKQVEEISFQDFVIKRHIQNNSNAQLWYLPIILIQLTLTFFSIGILKSKLELVYKKCYLPTHFAICLIITSIGLGFILSFDNLFSTVISGLLILIINYWALILLSKQGYAKNENEKN
jgi:hypothetical protein